MNARLGCGAGVGVGVRGQVGAMEVGVASGSERRGLGVVGGMKWGVEGDGGVERGLSRWHYGVSGIAGAASQLYPCFVGLSAQKQEQQKAAQHGWEDQCS